MKIGILTHFDSFQPSYALAVGWHERAKLLEHFNQDFDFLVSTRCPKDSYPNQKSILPRRPSKDPFDERVKFFENWYLENLQDYDAILTADLVYQRKGNFLAYNQAIRNASKKLKAKWFHWVHSGWVHRPANLEYPDSLRFTYHEGSKLIYLNSYELNSLAAMYGTSPVNCACVYNPKDPRTFFNYSEMTCQIIAELRLWKKEIVQIFPHCSTRMTAKGIDAVAAVFGALKRKGKQVAIIFANANSRSVQAEIEGKKREWLMKYNLVDKVDYIFTSEITEKFRPLPRKDVADLFRLANLFVFGSWRETVGNVFQEAKISRNCLVLNVYLPCLQEMGGKTSIYFHTKHKTHGVRDGLPGDMQLINYQTGEDDYMDHLAELILAKLKYFPDYQDTWAFSREWIWENQLRPLLYGGDHAGQ